MTHDDQPGSARTPGGGHGPDGQPQPVAEVDQKLAGDDRPESARTAAGEPVPVSEVAVPAGEPAAPPDAVAGHRPDGQPRPVAEVDEKLFEALTPLHRVRWITLIGFGCLLVAAVIILAVLYGGDHKQLAAERGLAARQQQVIAAQQVSLARQAAAIKASCRFYQSLTAVPVTPVPPVKRPSKVLVQLVTGARTAYRGEGCGKLPPPTASLTHWAKVYGVPVS
jgi:hypothetical protein